LCNVARVVRALRVIARGLCALAIALGLALLALNLYGLFRDWSKPEGALTFSPPPDQKHLLTDSLERESVESESEYFERLTLSIHYRMAHGWSADEPVPLEENYILNLMQYRIFRPPSLKDLQLYDHYEFYETDHALERRYGLCSQYAFAVYDMLDEQGIPALIAALDGHVVTVARSGTESETILDADYGVVMQHSIKEIEADPHMVRPYYEHAWANRKVALPFETTASYDGEEVGAILSHIYASPNDVMPITNYYGPTPRRLERLAYIAKWALPAALLIGGALGLVLLSSSLRRRTFGRLGRRRATA
jgi:hypothetical protein